MSWLRRILVGPGRSRADWVKRLAWSLVVTPPTLLFPLVFPLLSEPSLLFEWWDTYLLWFGLPFMLAAVLLLYGRRLSRAG